jgi:hypothetical protein
MGKTKLHVVLGLEAQGVAGPGQESLALADDPVLAAIKVNRDDTRDGRLCRDESGYGAGGRDLLVEEGNADGSAAEGLEDGEGGEGVLGLAAQADQSAAAGEEGLGGGERDGEERKRRADDVEASIWGGLVGREREREREGVVVAVEHTGRGDGRQGRIDRGVGVEGGRRRRRRGRDVDATRCVGQSGQARRRRSSAAGNAHRRRGGQVGHGEAGQWASMQSRLRGRWRLFLCCVAALMRCDSAIRSRSRSDMI